MRGPRTHLLFDFFGTLVDYNASRTEQGYPRSYDVVRRLGGGVDYDGFLAATSAVWSEFDRRGQSDLREFAVRDVVQTLLADRLGLAIAAGDVEAFTEAYLDEWNTGVGYLDGLADLVHELSDRYRLVVVTNTHQADLVPNHLKRMGLFSAFDAVITSVEVGWCKPHPAIYAAALDAVGAEAGSAVFVGDSYEPDFVGPRQAGMDAFLIDPDRRTAVPEAHRLTSIFDLPARLSD